MFLLPSQPFPHVESIFAKKLQMEKEADLVISGRTVYIQLLFYSGANSQVNWWLARLFVVVVGATTIPSPPGGCYARKKEAKQEKVVVQSEKLLSLYYIFEHFKP